MPLFFLPHGPIRRVVAVFLPLFLALAVLAAPRADARTSAGTLQCEVAGSVAFFVRSTRDVHCVFYRVGGPNEAYRGTLREFGLDFGATGAGVIVWEVLATTSEIPPGELAGTYAGVEAGAAAVVGGEARVLVGGSGNTIALQPISVEFDTGVNIAVGVASLHLDPLMRAADRGGGRAHPAVGVRSAPAHAHYGCGSVVHVTRGETLYGIARMCGVTLESLLAANPEIANVRSIRVGQSVRVPTHVGHHGDSPCGTRVIVHDGESLDEVAWRCGVTLHALLVENPGVRDVGMLEGGLVLSVPARGAGTPTRVAAAAWVEGPGGRIQPAPAERHRATVDSHTTPADYADGLSGGPDFFRVTGVEPGHVLNVRAGPSTSEAILARVPGGAVLANRGCGVFGNGRWCRVETTGGRRLSGWVSGDYLAEAADPAARVVAAPTATAPARAPAPARRASPTPRTAPRQAAVDEGVRTERVRFSRGETGTRVEGAVTGRGEVDYLVGARAGQTMAVTLSAAGVAYFNVLPPDGGPGDALFVGSRDGDAFEAPLPAEGDYTIRVYLMGGDRDEGRTVPYRLNVSVIGEAAATPAGDGGPAPPDSVDARHSDTGFHATGTIPCSAGGGQPTGQCDFGVVRRGEGTADVLVTLPDGRKRAIFFEAGEAAAFDRSEADGDIAMTTVRAGDLSIVTIGEERFEIPDAVPFGG